MADTDENAPQPRKQPFMNAGQWALFGGLIVVVVALSVALTVTLVGPTVDRDRESRTHLVNQIAALEERMAYYERELESLEQEQVEKQQARIPPALLDRLIEQEQSLQGFIESLRSGMQELAHMIQGSREWLELYNEQLDEVVEESEDRQQELEAFQQ